MDVCETQHGAKRLGKDIPQTIEVSWSFPVSLNSPCWAHNCLEDPLVLQ